MRYKRKRPVARPGAGYFKALSKLYGRDFPRQGGGCKGLLPVSHFLALVVARIEAQAVKHAPQRRAA